MDCACLTCSPRVIGVMAGTARPRHRKGWDRMRWHGIWFDGGGGTLRSDGEASPSEGSGTLALGAMAGTARPRHRKGWGRMRRHGIGFDGGSGTVPLEVTARPRRPKGMVRGMQVDVSTRQSDGEASPYAVGARSLRYVTRFQGECRTRRNRSAVPRLVGGCRLPD